MRKRHPSNKLPEDVADEIEKTFASLKQDLQWSGVLELARDNLLVMYNKLIIKKLEDLTITEMHEFVNIAETRAILQSEADKERSHMGEGRKKRLTKPDAH